MSAFTLAWGLRHGGILQSLGLVEYECVQAPHSCMDAPGPAAFSIQRLAYWFDDRVVGGALVL